MSEHNLNRRNFLRGAAMGTFGLAFGVEELNAFAGEQGVPQTRNDEQLGGAPVNIAVIGLGPRGREILTSLSRVGPPANVISICDSFPAPNFLRRASAIAPKATFVQDYKRVLSDPSIKAVFIATPSHKHRQIALDAIAAGKHVYCEAPLANTIADARAIAKAASLAKTVFQPGLQVRCNAQALHVGMFMHSNALGTITEARAQWHNKTKWRFAWPDPAREAELNWRLRKETSPGLLGEIGIHQLDQASWYLKGLPLSVSGYGATMLYKDGRTVPDTVQCVLEYPNNVRMLYDATLTSSFGGAYEVFLGNDAAVSLHDQRAWMFKEADSNQLGWEVFARKDEWAAGDPKAGTGMTMGTGIALVADATKQLALGKQPGEMGTDVTKTALHYAILGYLKSCQAGKRVMAREPTDQRPNPPLVPGPIEGYQATVVALKANEAVMTNSKIVFQTDWLSLDGGNGGSAGPATKGMNPVASRPIKSKLK